MWRNLANLRLAALLLLLLATATAGCSGGAQSAASAQADVATAIAATPSPPQRVPVDLLPANGASHVLDVASCDLFTGGPGVNTKHPQVVFYVETTFGQAGELLGYSDNALTGGPEPDFPKDAPVWVVVGYGDFPQTQSPAVPNPHLSYTGVWAVFIEGGAARLHNVSNEQYDLSQLGTVHEVPLPLPPCPEPIPLATAEQLMTPNGASTQAVVSTPDPQ